MDTGDAIKDMRGQFPQSFLLETSIKIQGSIIEKLTSIMAMSNNVDFSLKYLFILKTINRAKSYMEIKLFT